MCPKLTRLALTHNPKSAIIEHVRLGVANAIGLSGVHEKINKVFSEVVEPVDQVIWPLVKIKLRDNSVCDKVGQEVVDKVEDKISDRALRYKT